MSTIEKSVGGAPRLRVGVHAGDHVQGNGNAPVTLVEYGDFECPFCMMAHPIVKTLQRQLGGSLRFVFRNFPLSELHPHALSAAEAAESVGARAGEAAYWRMHALIYAHQRDSRNALDEAHLLNYAVEAGADRQLVQADLQEHAHVERVQTDFANGVRSGVNGTPTFFINGHRFDGDWRKIDVFMTALQEAAAGV